VQLKISCISSSHAILINSNIVSQKGDIFYDFSRENRIAFIYVVCYPVAVLQKIKNQPIIRNNFILKVTYYGLIIIVMLKKLFLSKKRFPIIIENSQNCKTVMFK